MEVVPVQLTDHQQKQEPQPVQHCLNAQPLCAAAAQPPAAQTNLQANPITESAVKSQQKRANTQQKTNVPKQKNHTAQAKQSKKNQKQLVGENFERMNYLYQCATRLARLTTPSLHDWNCRTHETTSDLTHPLHQQQSSNESKAAATILSVSNSVPVIPSPNKVMMSEVRPIKRRKIGDCGDEIASPLENCSASTRLTVDSSSNMPVLPASSDILPLQCALSTPSADSSNNQTTSSFEDHSSSCPQLPGSETLPSNNLTSSRSEVDYNTNPTSSGPVIDYASNSTSQSVVDSITETLPPCSGVNCNLNQLSSVLNQLSSVPVIDSNAIPTPSSPEVNCNTIPTSSCSETDSNTELTSSCSDTDCHSTPTSSCLEIASNVSSTCRAVGRKCLLRLSHHMKRELCRGCSTPLVPALTASAKIIRVRKKRVLSVRCLTCGVRRKRPCEDMKTLWADQCPTAV